MQGRTVYRAIPPELQIKNAPGRLTGGFFYMVVLMVRAQIPECEVPSLWETAGKLSAPFSCSLCSSLAQLLELALGGGHVAAIGQLEEGEVNAVSTSLCEVASVTGHTSQKTYFPWGRGPSASLSQWPFKISVLRSPPFTPKQLKQKAFQPFTSGNRDPSRSFKYLRKAQAPS
ncbi:hypothetical protein D3C80_1206290 [compost metagenome]